MSRWKRFLALVAILWTAIALIVGAIWALCAVSDAYGPHIAVIGAFAFIAVVVAAAFAFDTDETPAVEHDNSNL